MTIEIHNNIIQKFDNFVKSNKIPNIILHGPSGGGKRTLAKYLVHKIYNGDTDIMKSFVKMENCAHGKGIKFVREDLKFFAKTNLKIENSHNFKVIILSNADKLTIDAQSALRRCIEVFSHSTRFIMIVEDRYKLLKPILSRLCEIYVPLPTIKQNDTNLHQNKLKICFQYTVLEKKKKKELAKLLSNFKPVTTTKITTFTSLLYNRGFSGLDIITYIEEHFADCESKYQKLLAFNKIKSQFRNEKLFIMFLLNFAFLRSEYNLENVSVM